MKPSVVILAIFVMMLAHPLTAQEIVFNETIAGERNLGQNFTFTMSNLSGSHASAVYHFAVYDYRDIGQNYTYHSPWWGQWFTQDAEPGRKYLAVWVRGWLDGQAYFGWGADRFRLWIQGHEIQPEPVHMQDLSIGQYQAGWSQELVEVPALCPNAPKQYEVQEKPFLKMQNTTYRRLPVVIQELENAMARNERGQLTRERFGWKDENEMDRMEPGISNAFEGYILWQIPEEAEPEDILVSGDFRNNGAAFWHLTDTRIVQDSAERQQSMEAVLMDIEREKGIRLPDAPPDQGRTQA